MSCLVEVHSVNAVYPVGYVWNEINHEDNEGWGTYRSGTPAWKPVVNWVDSSGLVHQSRIPGWWWIT